MEAGVRGPGAVARRRGSRFLLVVVDAHRILDERREVRGDDHRRRLARVISVAAARGRLPRHRGIALGHRAGAGPPARSFYGHRERARVSRCADVSSRRRDDSNRAGRRGAGAAYPDALPSGTLRVPVARREDDVRVNRRAASSRRRASRDARAARTRASRRSTRSVVVVFLLATRSIGGPRLPAPLGHLPLRPPPLERPPPRRVPRRTLRRRWWWRRRRRRLPRRALAGHVAPSRG